jgi:hypothetical protein
MRAAPRASTPPVYMNDTKRCTYWLSLLQGKAKKTRKFAAVKRMISPRDTRMYVLALQ